MSFIKNNLANGEEIIVTAHVSWYSQFDLIVLGVAVYLLGLMFNSGLWVSIVGISIVAVAAINVYSTELALTNRRIIAKTGIIRRNTIELKATRVESLEVEQSVAGRILDYGSITIAGVGGSQAPIKYISKPLVFRQSVYNYIDDLKEEVSAE